MTRARFFGPVLLVLVAALSLGASCNGKPQLVIETPDNGTFTTQSSIVVTGRITKTNPAVADVKVNGVPVVVQPDRTWSATVALNTSEIINPIVVEFTPPQGLIRRRVTVLYGESIADGGFSPMGTALRLNDSGLDDVEPLVEAMVPLDIATLLPVGEQVINDFCAIDGGFLGCLGSVDVFVANPPPTFGGFSIDVDALTNLAAGDIDISNVRVDLDINGSGLAPSCGLRVTAVNTSLDGDYALSPDAAIPTQIDVNQQGSLDVSFSGFNDEFTSGLCDFPLIGDLIQLIIGDVEPTILAGLEGFLDDPDGAGPLDGPIADGIEVALADIEISGPIGQAIGVNLETPLFDVFEDVDGITLDSDTRITASMPDPNAVDQTASYHVTESFPTFSATTPVGGLPYDLGICISTSAFNQLLRAEVESGLLITSLTELDLGGGPLPLTAGLLGLFVPEFTLLDPLLDLQIELLPLLSPIVTADIGPSGEMAAMEIADLQVTIRELDQNSPLLVIRVDALVGLDVAFASGQLSFNVGALDVGSLNTTFTTNLLDSDEIQLDFVLQQLLPVLFPSLASSLGSFPLPDFLGLQLSGVEVGRVGGYLSIYTDLTPVP